jgi:hypothetical protein
MDHCPVSLGELIAKPEMYHLQSVTVEGYVTLRFEGNELCPNERPETSTECVWIDVEGLKDPGFRKGRVVVEGTFDGENLGHLGVASGTIGKVTRLERLR